MMFLVSAALADPGQLFPDAAPSEAGSLGLRGGGIVVVGGMEWLAAGPQVLVDWAPTERVEVGLQAPVMGMFSADFPGVGAATVSNVGVRVIALQKPRFSLAPTLTLAGMGGMSSANFRDGGGGATSLGLLGVAIDYRGEKWSFDANISGVGGMWEPGGDVLWLPPQEGAFLISQAGVSYDPEGPSRYRLGVNVAVPTFTWIYLQERWMVDVSVGSAGFISVAAAHAGVRW